MTKNYQLKRDKNRFGSIVLIEDAGVDGYGEYLRYTVFIVPQGYVVCDITGKPVQAFATREGVKNFVKYLNAKL